MVKYRILFLQRFKKMLDDGRYSQAVKGTPVEQMHITFNLECLGSRSDVLVITALTYQLLLRFPKKLAHLSVYGKDAVGISWPSPW